jgi:GAF domain-containing protein/anti-sigma regulatory factor (Ser/Thr protein kinase)
LTTRGAQTPRGPYAFIVIGLGLFVTAAGVWAWQGYHDDQAAARRQLMAEAGQSADRVNTFFSDRIALLQAIAAGPSVVARDLDKASQFFTRVRALGATSDLVLIDADGTLRLVVPGVAGNERPTGVQVNDRDYFRAAVRGRPYIGRGIITRPGSQLAVPIGVPIRGPRFEVVGVLATPFLLNQASARNSVFSSASGFIALDRDKQVVVAGQPITALRQVRDPALLARVERAPGPVTAERGLNLTASSVIAHARADVPGWTVLIERPASEIFGSAWRTFVARLLGIALVGLVGAASAATVLWRSQRRRLAQSTERRRSDLATARAVAERTAVEALLRAETVPDVLAVTAVNARSALGATTAICAVGEAHSLLSFARSSRAGEVDSGTWHHDDGRPCAVVARTGRPLVYADHAALAHEFPLSCVNAPEGASAFLALRVNAMPYGSLSVVGYDHEVDPDQVLATFLASETQVALERVIAAETTSRNYNRAEQLRAMVVAVASAPDFLAAGQAVAERIRASFGAERVAVYVDAIGALTLTGVVGAQTPSVPTRLDDSPDHPWARAAVRTDVTVFPTADVETTDGAWACVIPLSANDRFVGVAALGFSPSRRFDIADREFAVAVGAQCGQALERSRLLTAEHLARTQAEAASARLEIVYQLTAALTRAATIEEAADVFVTRGIALLGATRGGFFEWFEEDHTLRLRGGLCLGDDEGLGLARVSIDRDLPICQAAREQSPVFISPADELTAYSPETVAITRAAGDHALAALPLARAGALRAVVCLHYDHPQAFDTEQRALLTTIADRLAEALERAQLLDVERSARKLADERRRRAALRAEIGTSLESTRGSTERMQLLSDLLAGGFADHVRIETQTLDGVRQVIATTSAEHTMGLAASPETVMSIPFASLDGAPATLHLARTSADRPFTDDDRTFATDVAARAALSIENERLYERERSVASQMQLSLLGTAPTGRNGLDVACLYQAGAAELQVGGDWYDLIPLANGTVALVVGDVVGRGLQAAAAMGQLRSAVRALMPVSDGPAQVLERLDAFVESAPEARMTTVCLATLDPASGELRYACAGHPPPLILEHPDCARHEWGGRSAPLGAFGAEARDEDVAFLTAGATVVFYTDGLIERRGISLDDGLEHLRGFAATRAHGELDALPASLLHEMLDDPSLRDDVAILAVRLLRRPARLLRETFAAEPVQLAPLRQAFRAWCGEHDVHDDDITDLVLAVGEAASNAVEHAYHERAAGRVEIEARIQADDVVELTIRDYGHWRELPAPGNRGRGLELMRAISDSLHVERGESGTTLTLRRGVRRGDT